MTSLDTAQTTDLVAFTMFVILRQPPPRPLHKIALPQLPAGAEVVLGDPESLGRCDTESRGQEDLAIIRIPQVRKRRPVCIPGPGSERGLGLEIDAGPSASAHPCLGT